mmetsp:Transcript_98440/g.317362  ORF Transcript_98440/g.317362 Transcript_98440/m.317362 type:complete len:221 (-) Transcript_98440:102-764(-)
MAVLCGSWSTPLPVCFSEGEDGVLTSEAGDMQLQFDKETAAVTLTIGDTAVSGKLDKSFSRIRWQGGAVWAKDTSSKEFGMPQSDLLSEAQVNTVIDRINESVNIWVLTESMERALIEPPVRQVNGLLKESLRAFMLEDWAAAIEALLDESLPPDGKISTLSAVMGRQLREPLVEALNGRIDLPVIGEGMEEQLLNTVVDKVLDSIVTASVQGLEETGFV